MPDEPRRRLAIALCGTRELSSWQRGEVTPKNAPLMDFYDLKGILEALCQSLRLRGGAKAISTFTGRSASDVLSQGAVAALYLREESGSASWARCIHQRRERCEINLPVIACELDFEALTAGDPASLIAFSPCRPRRLSMKISRCSGGRNEPVTMGTRL